MARAFDRTNSQYMEYAGAVLSAYPYTMACWFRTTDLTNQQALITIGSTTTNARHQLYAGVDIAGDPVALFVSNGTTTQGIVTTTGISSGVWHHACARSSASNARDILIDGGSKGTGVTNITFGTVNRTSIGRFVTLAGAGGYHNGDIAEAAIWNIALSDDDALMLALGYSPLLIRPDALVGYWPIIGRYSPEIDVVGGFGMTLSASAPVNAAHPRVLYAA